MQQMKMLRVRLVDATGEAIPNVTARLRINGKKSVILTSRTCALGEVEFEVPERTKKGELELSPIAGHWSIGHDWDISAIQELQFKALRLPQANAGLGWWHEKLQIKSVGKVTTSGVRIGVIDTGCGPHAALSHVQSLGTFVDGKKGLAGIEDEGEHGSHVCGIIGARVTLASEYAGLASAADLFTARVPMVNALINQADIANAIDAMVDRDVHLINLSLGAETQSRALNDSIENAWLHGTLCFAAAGNTGDQILWPARHERVIAVTALGLPGPCPRGTLGARLLEKSSDPDRLFGMVFPGFSARGPNAYCCCPGVGIISTIRSDGYAVGAWGDLSGTSMASPLALSLLALVLARDGDVLRRKGDEYRGARIRELLELHCIPLDLDVDMQGNGLPVLDLNQVKA